MVKIILKSPYMKPSAQNSLGGYIRYIATRSGVEKPGDSKQNMSATVNQKKVIASLLNAYPDCKELYEYEDYMNNPIRENADDLIMRIGETHAELFGSKNKYVDYIATRPRAEKIAKHGLFTDEGVPVILDQVSREVSQHTGNVWTHIISLRREDAERLGYDSAKQWQELLRSQRNVIAESMKISPDDFCWWASFHNESHHPHVHMVAYSKNPKKAYLSVKGIEAIKSSLAKEIFRHDRISIYERQTEYRDDLRQNSRAVIADIISEINSGGYNNPNIEEMLLRLSEKLSNYTGKKVYGYLPPEDKALVDRVVLELASDERIARLYDLWYEQKENILHIYSDSVPDRIPLHQNPEFKTVRNAVIQEALNIQAEHIVEVDDEVDENVILPEATVQKSEIISANLENQYTTQPLTSMRNKSNWSAALCSLRLFQNVVGIINNRLEDDRKGKLISSLDRKEQQKINEKKQGQGIRISGQ